MKTVRLLLFLTVQLFFSDVVFGYTVGEVIEKARLGNEYMKMRHSLDSAVLALKQSVMKDSDKYAVGIDGEFDDFTHGDEKNWRLTPYVSYASRDKDTASVKVSVPIRAVAENAGGGVLYSPQVDFEKKILIDGVKDNGDELLRKKVDLEVYSQEKKMELKFRRTILNLLKGVVSAQMQKMQAESNVRQLKEEFENDLRLGRLEDGSTSHAARRAAVITAERAAKMAGITFESAKDSFRTGAGFEFDDAMSLEVDVPEKAEFEVLGDGNTDVRISEIVAEMDELNYGVYKNNDKNTIIAGANAAMEFGDDGYDGFLAGASVSYGGTFLSGSVSASVSKPKDGEAVPKIGFGVSLFNDTRKKTVASEERRLVAQMHAARIDALNALSQYLRDAMAMAEKMSSFDLLVSDAEAAFERETLLHEADMTLYEGGYLSETELESAEVAYAVAILSHKAALIDLLLMNVDAEELMV